MGLGFFEDFSLKIFILELHMDQLIHGNVRYLKKGLFEKLKNN